MSSPVEQIKNRLSIVDVISSYLKLERAGTNFRARCPFHNEKTPSFFVSPDRGSYYCFGCGAKGDIFSFVENFEGLDFRGALDTLARRAGVDLTNGNFKKTDSKENYFKIMESACDFFEKNLNANPEALKYLKDRGLSESTIKEFRLGFAMPEWSSLYAYLKSKNFSDLDIIAVGLAKQKEGSSSIYDRFRSRIMFPIADSSGRIIAFSGRIFGGDSARDPSAEAKYINSPETPLFNKSSILYGFDKAKSEIRKENFTILVEGQLDLLMSHQVGFKNTVAVSGTALADNGELDIGKLNHLGAIRNLSDNLFIALDSDPAGIKATARIEKIAINMGFNVRIVKLPKGEDPADFILKNGKDSWRECINNAKNIIEYYLDAVLDYGKDGLIIAKAITQKVLPYVALLKNATERDYFLRMISQKSGIRDESLWKDLETISKNLVTEKNTTQKYYNNQILPNPTIRKLFGMIFLKKEDSGIWKERLKNILGEDIMKTEEDRALGLKDELLFEAEVYFKDKTNIEKEIEEMLFVIEEEKLANDFKIAMDMLSLAEKSGDEQKTREYLEKCQNISKAINNLKRNK